MMYPATLPSQMVREHEGLNLVRQHDESGRLPRLVSEWKRNNRETIRVRLDDYQGSSVFDLRSWYADTAGELKPGKSGITLSVKHLPATAAAIMQALKEARELGLLGEEEKGGGE